MKRKACNFQHQLLSTNLDIKKSAKYMYIEIFTWWRSGHKVNKLKQRKAKRRRRKKPKTNPVLEVNPP